MQIMYVHAKVLLSLCAALLTSVRDVGECFCSKFDSGDVSSGKEKLSTAINRHHLDSTLREREGRSREIIKKGNRTGTES